MPGAPADSTINRLFVSTWTIDTGAVESTLASFIR